MVLPNKDISFLAVLILVLILLPGCASPRETETDRPTSTTTRSAQLTVYASPTPAVTRSPTGALSSATPVPSATPTPRTHEVLKGEDLFGIALRYGVTLDEIKTANPTVNPQFLSVGTNLTIPQSSGPTPTPNPRDSAAVLTPTPVPAEMGSLNCLPAGEGGAWCFLLVHNAYDFGLENPSALIHLSNPQTGEIQTYTAFLPLDILPAGVTLPLTAYIPPPVSLPFDASGQLVTSLPHAGDDGRYLPVQIENLQIVIEESGQSAAIGLDARLEQGAAAARLVRIAAVAYDVEGKVIGVRRLENENASALAGGEALSIAMRLYSVAGTIDRVEVFAEARP